MSKRNKHFYIPVDNSVELTSVYSKAKSFFVSPKADEEENDGRTLFAVDSIFWQRAFRIFKEGLGTPWQNPVVWLLIALNILVQCAGGYIAQDVFYYTGTGTAKIDPGMSGCLKRVGKIDKKTKKNVTLCSHEEYQKYLDTFAWSFFVLCACVCIYSVTGDMIK